jgi:hypothetical protein
MQGIMYSYMILRGDHEGYDVESELDSESESANETQRPTTDVTH